MFEFFQVANAIGAINQYFREEVKEKDFWELEKDNYPGLAEEKSLCFTIDPEKLKKKYREAPELFIVTEQEKEILLKAFKILRSVSDHLPDSASLSERLFAAKQVFPAVLFRTEEEVPSQDEGKVIPLFKEKQKNIKDHSD